MFDFSADSSVKEMWQEFLYGPAYLVCPITRPMEYGPESTPLNESKETQIYLPKGTDWYHEETDIFYEGGQEIFWTFHRKPLRRFCLQNPESQKIKKNLNAISVTFRQSV